MSHLQLILDRLIAENLHEPITTTLPSLTTFTSISPRSHQNIRSGSLPDQKDDLGVEDSRWLGLFVEYFLENSDSKNDDLLFFVRQMHPENDNMDPVFVKRKVAPNTMPPLDHPVLWKETFFLNLIVQLPCKLTVAVCTRTPPPPTPPPSIPSTTDNINNSLSSSNVNNNNNNNNSNNNNNNNEPPNNQKSSMTCSSKHVSKRVYALPTKSRMDVKDSSMECSYPLIYYVIDDYEDMFENLIVSQDEYLCVELAVTMPNSTTNKDDDDDDYDYDDDYDDDISDDYYYNNSNRRRNNRPRRSMTNNPFPQQNDTKVILFQGAASYTSLFDVYQQKADGKLNRRFKIGPTAPPTEYVMMRGPHGKGHAQVAITALSLDESIAEQEQEMAEITKNNINNSTSNTNNSDGNNSNNIHNNKSATISAPQRSNSTNSFFQSLKRLSQSITEKQTLSNTENLKCCMTFVNVPWASIVS